MSGAPESIFVDTGAWIALAVTSDPFHARAKEAWGGVCANAKKIVTSIPVVIETFTFLDRHATREVATTWRDQVTRFPRARLTECTLADLTKAWHWFEHRRLRRLSVVDATSFVLMQRLRIRHAFAFDQHFAQAGFVVHG